MTDSCHVRPRHVRWAGLLLLTLTGLGLPMPVAASEPVAEPSPISRLAIWCEFMPYDDVLPHLPVLAAHRCDLLLHVERESLSDPAFHRLLRAAADAGVGVDAWLLLPYDEHLYVGQASVDAVRRLALDAAQFFRANHLPVRAFVFDCEPSPLLGRDLLAAVLAKSPRRLIRLLKDQLDPDAFHRDTASLNALLRDLRDQGFAVDGAANRVFLDTLHRGNPALEDALNAPVHGIDWNALSFITYRYRASQLSYVAMLTRTATLARLHFGPRAALDLGLIGDYADIPQNTERAALFGGGDRFADWLHGMTDTRDLQQATSTALACGVTRINLYALDGAVTSVAGLDRWLRAVRRARPLTFWERWTPVRSMHYAALGALTEKNFRWFTGASAATHGKVQNATETDHPRQR